MKHPQRFLPSLRLPASVALAFLLAAALVAGCASPGGSKPRKVLVVTVTTGFRHSSIETAERVIEQLGRDSGAFTVDFARVTPPPAPSKPAEPKDTGDAEKLKADREKYEAAMEKFRADDARYQPEAKRYAEEQKRVLAEKMSPAALQQYAGVIFANTTGDIPLPDPQGFIDWVKAGHGFAATHSGSDTFHGFKPYIEMLGGEFLTHGAQATVDCVNQDTKHAACQHLPARWTVRDEIYLLKSFTRSSVHGLLTLEKHPNSGEPGDYPIAWCKQFGKGRVFYTSLGHREDIWDPNTPANFKRQNSKEVSLAYQQHLLNGIKWTLGLANGSAKP
ncbi:MAG TPA: ThuA domain-containing protein [Candidatus Saccharimonadales bacterium]|nr:ThuA domain-containing protein [Candidatus Saccharimonadales bacterium]